MASRHLFVLATIAWFIIPAELISSINLTGVIQTVDGTPPKIANVFLVKMIEGGIQINYVLDKALQNVKCLPDGSFTMNIQRSGYHKLIVTSPNHEFLNVPLILIRNNDHVNVSVQLAPFRIEDDSDILIVGDWNKVGDKKAEKMERTADGKYFIEKNTENDSVTYHIKPSLRAYLLYPATNGTMSDEVIQQQTFGYKSQVKSRENHIRIVFDPAQLPKGTSNSLPVVHFDSDHSNLDEIFILSKQFLDSRVDHILTGDRADIKNPGKNVVVDHSDYRAKLLTTIRDQSKDLMVRQFAAVAFAQPFAWSELNDLYQYGNELIKIVPPKSEMWSIGGIESFYVVANNRDGSKNEQVCEAFVKENPEREIQGMALTRLVEHAMIRKDHVRQATLYKEAVSKFANTKGVRLYLKMFAPDSIKKRTVIDGTKVPRFTFELLSNQQKLSNRDLLGKVYLIDFWAVWCSGCIAEMPTMHRLYNQYKESGFTIVSVALDSKKRVEGFQKNQWKMPWQNVVLDGDARDSAQREFEVEGLPKPILVDKNGKIIAIESDARGAKLEAALSKIFKKKNEGNLK